MSAILAPARMKDEEQGVYSALPSSPSPSLPNLGSIVARASSPQQLKSTPELGSRPQPPPLVSRISAQSLRSNASSPVASIPEDGPYHATKLQTQARRSSVLSTPTSRPGGGGVAGSRGSKSRLDMSREGVEMNSLGKVGGGTGGTIFTAVTTGSSKEDLAMAKWRKWAVDQPPVASPHTQTTPIRSRKASSSSLSYAVSPTTIPSASHSPLPLSTATSPLHIPGFSSRHPSDAPSYVEASSTRSASASASASGSGRQGPRVFNSGEIYLTDSVRALQDVELAVDEDIMARTTAQSRQHSRLLSTHPRVSVVDNAFMDIVDRLVSRRIRPIVLELVHALGHYIYILWSMTYPERPCPWIMTASDNTQPPLLRGWRSYTITAVAEHRAAGAELATPSPITLAFWRAEVGYALRDVEEVVGVWKKRGRIFASSLEAGQYGQVEDGNVLGTEDAGAGGNMARLLNDLEEAIWGDSLPRSTDLVLVLPADFDPYAIPVGQGVLSPAGGGPSSLGDAFGPPTTIRSPISGSSHVAMDDVYAMPDLISPSPGHVLDTAGRQLGDEAGDTVGYDLLSTRGNRATTGAHTNQGVVQAWAWQARASVAAQGGLSGPSGEGGAELAQLTLEEVGRQRHAEWLASQRS